MAYSSDISEGGYKVNLKKGIPRKWQCPLCDLLMRDAIQTYRGEMACESCFLKGKGDSQICPIDNEPIADGEFFQDRHARREISQLECYCINQTNGCSWEGLVSCFDIHIENCNYERLCCANCQQFINRIAMDRHLQDFCRFRKVACAYCDVILNAQTIKEHEATCYMKPTDCPYMCGANIQLNSIYEHVQMCRKVVNGDICPYHIVGCGGSLEQGLSNHLHEHQGMHAALALVSVKCLQESNEKMKRDLMTEQTLRSELEDQMKEFDSTQKAMQADLTTWQSRYKKMEADIAQLKETSDTRVREVQESLNELDLIANGSSMEEIDTKLNEIGQRYVEVEETLNNNPGGSADMPSAVLNQDLHRGRIDQLESGNAVLSANLSELEMKLQLLENTCYDGHQLWKVDNITYRTSQAVSGKVSALHSAPCFQKRGGYKFCSRLYLNGDGMGRGTHVSLFFVIMKSEYDALLQWPFSLRVTFRLINPHNIEDSVVESFIPDRNSSSFKRPTKDMNIAAGCPMFLRKELLTNYVVDDVLYIETKIAAN